MGACSLQYLLQYLTATAEDMKLSESQKENKSRSAVKDSIKDFQSKKHEGLDLGLSWLKEN